MSTKIYDAYKFNGSVDEIIPTMIKMRELYLEKYIYNDFKRWYKNPFTVIPKEQLNKFAEENILLKDLGRFEFFDFIENDKWFIDIFKQDVCFYFMENKIYCQFFNVNSKFIKEFAIFTDYHYQDNSDMSNYDSDVEKWKDMSFERQEELEKDWDERKILWDKIFDYYWTPNSAGLTYDLSIYNNNEYKMNFWNIFHTIYNDIALIRKFKIKSIIENKNK